MGFFSGLAKAVLPAVGTAFGGPLGGMAGAAIGGMIGGDKGRSIGQDIGTSLGNAAGGAYSNYQNMNSAQRVSEEQSRINEQQQANFERSLDFNANEAAKNRDFQAQQSNTQYQRAVGDLEAAGLNPMLAYSQGGAGNLSGATASAGGAPQLQNPSGAGVAATVALQNTAADTELKKAQAAVGRVEVDKSIASTQNIRVQTQNLQLGHYELEQKIKLLTSQAENEQERSGLIKLQKEMEIQNIMFRRGELDIQEYSKQQAMIMVDIKEYEKQITGHKVPEAKAWGDMYRSAYGRMYPYSSTAIQQGAQAFGAITGGVGSLVRSFGK